MARRVLFRVGSVGRGAALAAMIALDPTLALAQSAPAEPARLDDILISQDDAGVAILVKLSQQPSAASARADADALVIEIDGLALAPFAFGPPKGLLVAHVEGEPSGDGGSQLLLAGAALEGVDAVIYRKSVLIRGRLTEPKLAAARSLMATADASTTVPNVKAPAVIPAPQAAPQPERGLAVADLAGVTPQRCAEAPAALQKDSWNLPALGDHALCLLQSGKATEAKNRLDQLAAFQPDDWRVALGRADLALRAGEVAKAKTILTVASAAAPDDASRNALTRADAALSATEPDKGPR